MKQITALCFVTLFVVSHAHANQEVFSDRAAYEAALTGTVSVSDYSALNVLGDLEEVAGPVDQPWGSITFSASPFGGTNSIIPFPVPARDVSGAAPEDRETSGISFPADTCLSLNLDTANNGPFEGFAFERAAFGTTVTVTLFDSNDNQIGVPIAIPTDQDFFGLICSGMDVSRIEYCGDADFANFYVADSFSFNPISDEGELTSQEKLQETIDDLTALLSVASQDDQFWIESALFDLTCAQDPTFFATENRLSEFGTGFFNRVFWATYALECVSDGELVSGSLIQIQDLLSCVVDAEIDFALENPDANDCLLEYANFFEDYANQFADAEFYLQAVLLHFYAWVFAFFA